jgi:8-oxo-dGTP pyrophosphatase MutT (NUDIX family)
MKKVESFGIVPIKREDDMWKVLLILHREGNHWGFPKGKANPGEEPLETACRELKEETNLSVVEILHMHAFSEHYQFRRKKEQIFKTAHYYPATVEGELKCQEEEIRDARWLTFEEALAQLSFRQARHILRETIRLLSHRSS